MGEVTQMRNEYPEWVERNVLEVGEIQDTTIWASFDEVGLVHEVGLDPDLLKQRLVTYAKGL